MASYQSVHTGQEIDTAVSLVATKQDKLTAGDNITITNNVISASGGGGKTNFVIATVPANGSAGTITVPVYGMTADDHPLLDVYIEAATLKDSSLANWACVYRAESATDAIILHTDAATSQFKISIYGASASNQDWTASASDSGAGN